MDSIDPSYSQSQRHYHSQDRSHAGSQAIRLDRCAFGISRHFPVPEGILSFCSVEQQRGGRVHEPGSCWLVKFDSLADLWHFLKGYDIMMCGRDSSDGSIERPSYRIKEIIYERNIVKLLAIRSPWENLE